MNRLAKINNCNNINDFSEKFFNSCGKELLLTEPKPVAQNNNEETT